jgi:hypothetical protein
LSHSLQYLENAGGEYDRQPTRGGGVRPVTLTSRRQPAPRDGLRAIPRAGQHAQKEKTEKNVANLGDFSRKMNTRKKWIKNSETTLKIKK